MRVSKYDSTRYTQVMRYAKLKRIRGAVMVRHAWPYNNHNRPNARRWSVIEEAVYDRECVLSTLPFVHAASYESMHLDEDGRIIVADDLIDQPIVTYEKSEEYDVAGWLGKRTF